MSEVMGKVAASDLGARRNCRIIRWLIPLAAAASVAVVAGVWWAAQGRAPEGLGLRVADVAGKATIENGKWKMENWGKDSGVRGQWPACLRPESGVLGLRSMV